MPVLKEIGWGALEALVVIRTGEAVGGAGIADQDVLVDRNGGVGERGAGGEAGRVEESVPVGAGRADGGGRAAGAASRARVAFVVLRIVAGETLWEAGGEVEV